MHLKNLPLLMRIFALWTLLDAPLLVVGLYAAGFGRRWGASVLLVWLTARIGLHLAIGAHTYREVMARPWPHVAPLGDEDWDD